MRLGGWEEAAMPKCHSSLSIPINIHFLQISGLRKTNNKSEEEEEEGVKERLDWDTKKREVKPSWWWWSRDLMMMMKEKVVLTDCNLNPHRHPSTGTGGKNGQQQQGEEVGRFFNQFSFRANSPLWAFDIPPNAWEKRRKKLNEIRFRLIDWGEEEEGKWKPSLS